MPCRAQRKTGMQLHLLPKQQAATRVQKLAEQRAAHWRTTSFRRQTNSLDQPIIAPLVIGHFVIIDARSAG